jgi:hypothetical protein
MNWDIVWFLLAPSLALVGILIYHAYGNLRKLQDNWSEYRCNPLYMPFAGLVDEKTGTAGNFRHCMGLIGKNAMSPIVDVFYSLLGSVVDALSTLMNPLKLVRELEVDALSTLMNPLKLVRELVTRIRKFVLSFANSSLGKASAPVSAFVYYLNKIQDLLRRMVGEGYIAAMFGASAVAFMESFVTLCISVIKGFVYAMLAISIVLALFQPELLAIVLVIASMMAAAGA